jgi:hypothetical protein
LHPWALVGFEVVHVVFLHPSDRRILLELYECAS